MQWSFEIESAKRYFSVISESGQARRFTIIKVPLTAKIKFRKFFSLFSKKLTFITVVIVIVVVVVFFCQDYFNRQATIILSEYYYYPAHKPNK